MSPKSARTAGDWHGEVNPSTDQATKAPVCRCERPMPIEDDELGRRCLACAKRLETERPFVVESPASTHRNGAAAW